VSRICYIKAGQAALRQPAGRAIRGFASPGLALAQVIAGSAHDNNKIRRTPMRYAVPDTPVSVLTLTPRYGNYIGGEFVPTVKGRYFSDTSPVYGSVIDELPHSSAADIDKALDAENWDNGKAVRETLNADVPLCADHFRYCAGCIRDNSPLGSF